jgi:hypothetical protein
MLSDRASGTPNRYRIQMEVAVMQLGVQITRRSRAWHAPA